MKHNKETKSVQINLKCKLNPCHVDELYKYKYHLDPRVELIFKLCGKHLVMFYIFFYHDYLNRIRNYALFCF